MATNRTQNRRILALAAVILLLGVAAVAAPAVRTADAAPAQQAVTCAWQNIGTSTKDLQMPGYAMDTDMSKLYVYGGANGSNDAQAAVEVGDMSGASLGVTHRTVSAGGAVKLIGPAGAYRAKGDTDDSAAYFFGGLPDPNSGAPRNDVQRYLTKAGNWEKISPANQTTFTARYLAAAAYDPDHDVIWVTGGIANCALSDVTSGRGCNARNLATVYLSFDASGTPTWNGLANGDLQVFGHTMVYDSTAKRMILFGGSTDFEDGSSTLTQLDLSDPDPAKATFSNLNSSGASPSVFLHGATYDPTQNWMIVTGGTKSNFLTTQESVESKTYKLDLGAATPTWSVLTNYRERVAGAMVYVPKFGVSVFTLGRNRITQDPVDNPPKIDRKTDALVCAAAPTATTPAPTVPVPTNTPGGVAPTNTPVPTPVPQPEECAFLAAKVPGQVRTDALANPGSVYGYQMLCNPNLPPSPYNTVRNRLSMQNPAKPYHPLYNGLVWSCGCP